RVGLPDREQDLALERGGGLRGGERALRGAARDERESGEERERCEPAQRGSRSRELRKQHIAFGISGCAQDARAHGASSVSARPAKRMRASALRSASRPSSVFSGPGAAISTR